MTPNTSQDCCPTSIEHLLIKVTVFHRILVLVSGLGAGFSATINMYRATKDMYILTRIVIGE